MRRFKKLQAGEIARDTIREYVKERNDFHRYLCCGRIALSISHPLPVS